MQVRATPKEAPFAHDCQGKCWRTTFLGLPTWGGCGRGRPGYGGGVPQETEGGGSHSAFPTNLRRVFLPTCLKVVPLLRSDCVPRLHAIALLSEARTMRKPINVVWEDRPSARIVSIAWDCGCEVDSDDPYNNRICKEHRKEIMSS